MAGMTLCTYLTGSGGPRAGAGVCVLAITREQCDFCDFPIR
jgi:hypothetical protein